MQETVYHTNYKLEDTYWWFTARNSIVLKILKHFVKPSIEKTILDVGCGTGGFAHKIKDDYNLIGLDSSEIALEYSQQRGISNVFLGNLQDFQSVIPITAMTILDVIEHIDDDKDIVSTAHNLLENNGYVVATVPAYQWLWSQHDVLHMHYRRYTLKRFKKLFQDAGFRIEYSSYFNTLLFPIAFGLRFYQKITKTKNVQPVDEVSPFVNSVLNSIFMFEKKLLPSIRFPFGMSIILVAKKIEKV